MTQFIVCHHKFELVLVNHAGWSELGMKACFLAIRHGDVKHQAWLLNKLKKVFP